MIQPDPVPEALLTSVVRWFAPVRVILFGSHARGEAGPDSDWDLLVVLDDDVPPEKLSWRSIPAARGDYHLAVDIDPCRLGWFERKRGVVSSLAWTAAIEGHVVYERADPSTATRADRLRRVARACAALPVLDPRPPDEILGHDEHGLPR